MSTASRASAHARPTAPVGGSLVAAQTPGWAGHREGAQPSHLPELCPESRLVVAVLARAIHDSLSLSNRRMRREARRFLLGDDLTLWCDLVGCIRTSCASSRRKAGYLADEGALAEGADQVPVLPHQHEPVVSASARPCIPSPATP